MPSSPSLARRRALERLASERYDLLVVGGGITGAGIARDAALRGLRTALVERADFGGGTSGRSSRLVHGGVRYLEHGQIGLVFEASRERARLLRLAPHVVRPLAFTWPVYRGARVPRWKLGVGLWLYDALARFRNVGRHERLTAADVLRAEPRLRPDGLVGGARYWDAATDDARLTLLTALGALDAGATVVNHAEVAELLRRDGRTRGAVVRDRITGEKRPVSATIVVNATGPWTDALLRLDGASVSSLVRGTKGVHVLVPRERVGNVAAVTLVSAVDGRVMFVLPAGPFALIGTTDTPTVMPPDQVRATAADVEYLLASANATFPDARLTGEDVISAWAGIRPLIAGGEAGEPAAASREHRLTRSPSGLLTITGGKLTTYRAMAEEAVDVVMKELRRPLTASTTGHVPLPGGELAGLETETRNAEQIAGARDVAERLVGAYGSRWRRVWALVEGDAALGRRLHPHLPYLRAEVVWATTRELACTLGDVLVRRTHLAFETRDHGASAAAEVADLLATPLGWSPATHAARLADYHAEIEQLFGVEELEPAVG